MDYSVRFNEIACDNLVNNWRLYSENLREYVFEKPRYTIDTPWSDEVEIVLQLVKVFPAKARTNYPEVLPFVKAIEKLIVFRKVCS